MTTKTTEEAMLLLEKHRAERIVVARECADRLIERDGFTTAPRVYELMRDSGRIPEGEKLFWLGAVFRGPKYEWTGEMTDGTFSNRNHEPKQVKVWIHRGG